LDFSGGVLGGSGTYDIAGYIVYKGLSSSDVIQELGGNVDLTLRSGFFIQDIFPDPDFSTPGNVSALAALKKIDAGASLTLTDNATMFESDLTNAGTLKVLNGASLDTLTLTNMGYLLLTPDGLISASDGFTQSGAGSETEIDSLLFANVDLQGGLLHGIGTIVGSVNQTGGTLHPGNSPGQLNITGDFTMGPGVFLNIDFASSDPFGTAGVDWSFLNVGGNAQLDGIVTVDLLPSLTFHLGDLFKILQFGTLSANPLLTVQFLELGGGMHFEPFFTGNELDLRVTADAPPPPSTPEPGTIVLLVTGLAGLAVAVRRRKV
jgi:hypothetical protein